MTEDNRKVQRSIAAPFQNRSNDISTVIDAESQSIASSEHTDFRTYSFPQLKPLTELTHEEYFGPTTESNWVIPNILLVGAYPATQDDQETFEIISSILKLGIKKFVCLQQEYRPGVPEELWRSGLALRPYFHDVVYMVKNKASFPHFQNHKIVDELQLGFEHCPIVDCGITDDSKVLNLAKKLVHEISRGEVIYLHCWGGHGRTGTVVSIMLHLMYGLNSTEAMTRCQAVHDLRKCPVNVGSPQTQAQRDQVTRIINKLFQQYDLKNNPSLNSFILHANTSHQTSGKPVLSKQFGVDDQKKDVKQSSSKKLNRPYQSFNAVYDHSKTTSNPETKPSRFPYFNNLPTTGNEQTSSRGKLSQQNQSSENLSGKIPPPKQAKQLSLGKGLLLNEKFEPHKGPLSHQNSKKSSNGADPSVIIKVPASNDLAKENLGGKGLHSNTSSRAQEGTDVVDTNHNGDTTMQYVHIDSSHSDDQLVSKPLASGEPHHPVAESVSDPVRLPNTNHSRQSSILVSNSESTVKQALSGARKSIVGNVIEKAEATQPQTKNSKDGVTIPETKKSIFPSRPTQNAGTVSRFGVANFMNRKVDTSKTGGSNQKDAQNKEFLNIFS